MENKDDTITISKEKLEKILINNVEILIKKQKEINLEIFEQKVCFRTFNFFRFLCA